MKNYLLLYFVIMKYPYSLGDHGLKILKLYKVFMVYSNIILTISKIIIEIIYVEIILLL